MRQAHPADAGAPGPGPDAPPPAAAADFGVLLTNLGTPDAPTPPAIRRYLREFLWDPRVIEVPRPIWWVALNGIILPLRSRRSARAYRRVWTDEGSPLLVNSRRQAAALDAALDARGTDTAKVVLAMRYGRPSIAEGLDRLRGSGCRRVLVFPLYPQYSATTTASTFDAVARILERVRHIPEVRFVADYHDEPAYIEALAASVSARRNGEDPAPRLLVSFHGLPERYVRAGDPYRDQCERTARLLAKRLGLGAQEWALGFQSRFGREPWLEPYTDDLLDTWAREGIEEVDVVCPGFSADCLETLDEIAVEYREQFLAAGGRRLRYLPALNDRPDHIEALAGIVWRHARGWGAQVDPGPG